MAKNTAPLLPPAAALLLQFGERLRLARQRRRLSAKQVAQRAGMSPMTLRSLERGGSGVTMGAYLMVMQVLGVEADLDLLVQADPMGRALQDARMPAMRPTPSAARVPSPLPEPSQSQAPTKQAKSTEGGTDWKKSGGFASSDVLATLIELPPPLATKKR